MMRTQFTMIVAMSGCCFIPAAPPDPSQTAVPVIAAPAPAPPPAPSNTIRQIGGLAQFDGDALANCADAEVIVTPPDPLPAEWPIHVPSMFPTGGPNLLRIDRACVQQFPERTVTASCIRDLPTTTRPDGVTINYHTSRRWYDASVFGNDRHMRDCLGEGGTWWRMDPNSPEAELMIAERDLRRLERRYGR